MDGIEQEFKGKLEVIRINVQDPVGQVLSREYRFEFTPTFIFFDPHGEEIWRGVGAISPNQIRDLMSEL